jgi:tetratricopeptide (TPR) repeat protein
MQLLKWIFALLLFGGIAAGVVIYNKEITLFSETYQLKKDGQAAIRHKNWQKALEIYEKGAKAHPEDEQINLTLAKLYQAQGTETALAQSEILFKDLIRKSPENVTPKLAYANLLMAQPLRQNDALAVLRDGMKSHRQNAKLFATIGDVFKKAAENPCEYRPKVQKWLYDWSIYYYRHSAKLNPKRYNTQFNLGIAYQQTNELDKAAKSYCQALILSPKKFEAHYNLGVVLSELKLVDEGYRHLTQSVELLREADRLEEAQALAEQVQIFKNTMYNNESIRGLSPQEIPEEILDKQCQIPSNTESSPK